jgi:tetratricopeptide (TPR) repeat protein
VATKRTWRQRLLRQSFALLVIAAVGWGGTQVWFRYRADRALREAKAAFHSGRYGTALLDAQDVLRLSPGQPEASLLAGRCLVRLGREAEADPLFRQAGLIALEDLRERANALTARGPADRAIPVLETILQINPQDPEALRRLAAIHHARGEYVLAIELAERLARDSDNEVVGQALIGTVHHDLATQKVETPGAAIEAFERVLELDPDLRKVPIQPKRLFWDFLARDLIAEGRTAQAREHLQRALAGGEDAGLLELLGQTYWAEGEIDQARKCWERAQALDPSRSDPWLDLGQLALHENRNEEAVRYLEHVLRLSPDSINPLYKLIQAHRRLGHSQQANALQKRVDRLRSAHPGRAQSP